MDPIKDLNEQKSKLSQYILDLVAVEIEQQNRLHQFYEYGGSMTATESSEWDSRLTAARQKINEQIETLIDAAVIVGRWG